MLPRADAAAHEVLLCVQTGATMADTNRFKFDGDSYYLKSPAEMRYVRVGAALTARLGRSLIGETIVEDRRDDEVLGSLTAVYGRCARQRMPIYQSARYDFGDGAPVTFGRLVLPLSPDGSAITQLVGVALFNGRTS